VYKYIISNWLYPSMKIAFACIWSCAFMRYFEPSIASRFSEGTRWKKRQSTTNNYGTGQNGRFDLFNTGIQVSLISTVIVPFNLTQHFLGLLPLNTLTVWISFANALFWLCIPWLEGSHRNCRLETTRCLLLQRPLKITSVTAWCITFYCVHACIGHNRSLMG